MWQRCVVILFFGDRPSYFKHKSYLLKDFKSGDDQINISLQSAVIVRLSTDHLRGI